MKKSRAGNVLIAAAALFVCLLTAPLMAMAGEGAEIDREVDAALETLYANSPGAKALAEAASGILVFPKIVKGGLVVGGQYGEGALRKGGETKGYYSTFAASYGLQAGIQSFGYALFFMKEAGLEYLKESDGLEIGVGPSIVLVDEGMARSLTTTTAQEDIYAFFFNQKGLMAGAGIQGSKIEKITPGKKD